MKYYLCLIIPAVSFIPSLTLAQSAGNEFKVPFKFALGKSLYQKNCSSCHGVSGYGVEKKGPPLMHKFYEPSHHGDESFYRAALKGVKAHHWNFGDMKPVAGISRREVSKIVPYVRWLQREHGIK